MLKNPRDIDRVLRAFARSRAGRTELDRTFMATAQRVADAWDHYDGLTEERERIRKIAGEAEQDMLKAAVEVLVDCGERDI